MKAIRRVCIVVNTSKNGAVELAGSVASRLESLRCEVVKLDQFPFPEDGFADCELAIVIGGDGTILSIVEAAFRQVVPVMGVNLGRLGFMAHFTAEDCLENIDEVVAGHFQFQRRSLLSCIDADGAVCHALNEVVIRAASSRLVPLRVTADGEAVNQYSADGLLFATPTGSTAYNLSAGGPIIHPDADVMVMTPINPHTLSNRAIVLDAHCRMEVSAGSHSDEVLVSTDGREAFDGKAVFPLSIQVEQDHQFLLVQPKGLSHYGLLRNKLQWTGDSPLRDPAQQQDTSGLLKN